MTNQDEVVIAVMGATGSGKSSFINLVSGSKLIVGDGLKSCTASVSRSNVFELFGRRIALVDTPGFDDTTISDTDVLKMIALYLATTYEQGCKMSGVIYMHRISDFRVGGASRRNFNMFRKLCGDSALHNVVIVTNMWGEVTPERGAARELELATDDQLFKPVLREGARMLRYDNSLRSAQSILLHLLHNTPQALRIQSELVDERKDICDTDAGQELEQHLVELTKKHRVQLAEIQMELEEALQAKDIQSTQELEHARKELEERIYQSESDRSRLSTEYAEMKRKADERVEEVMRALRSERQQREDHERRLARLIREADSSAADRARWQREMQEVRMQREGGWFSKLGQAIDGVLGGIVLMVGRRF